MRSSSRQTARKTTRATEMFGNSTSASQDNTNKLTETIRFLDAYRAVIISLPMHDKARSDDAARAEAARSLANDPNSVVIADIGKIPIVARPEPVEIAAMIESDAPYKYLVCLKRQGEMINCTEGGIASRNVTDNMITPSVIKFASNINDFPSESLEAYVKAKEIASMKLFSAYPSPRLAKNGIACDIQSSNDKNLLAPFEERIKSRKRIFSMIRKMQEAGGCGEYSTAITPSIRKSLGETHNSTFMLLVQQYKAAGVAAFIARQQNCSYIGAMLPLSPSDIAKHVSDEAYNAAAIAYGISSYCAELIAESDSMTLSEALDIIDDCNITEALQQGVDIADIMGDRKINEKLSDVNGIASWEWETI